MTEQQQAIELANRVLDRVSADPDDDLAVLARQLIRTSERNKELEEALEPFAAFCPSLLEYCEQRRSPISGERYQFVLQEAYSIDLPYARRTYPSSADKRTTVSLFVSHFRAAREVLKGGA